MYHQPTVRKQPKRYNQEEGPNQEKVNFIQRNKQVPNKKPTENSSKPLLPKINPKTAKTIPQKVEQLEKAVERLGKGGNPPEMQRLLLQEIQGIKSQLKEIKQQIGLGHPDHHKKQKVEVVYDQEEGGESGGEEEENIYDMVPRQYEEVRQPPEVVRQSMREESKNEQRVQSRMNQSRGQVLYQTYQKRELQDIGKIQPYMKQFKLEASKIPLAIYPGYHKKSSKPVVIKYCSEETSMEPLLALYERLWKNIVKAKKICINKVYDLNQPMAHNIMALEMNQYSLLQIQLTPQNILKDVLRAMQFLHDCGLLYRDLHPSHVMQSYDGNVVLLGLRRCRRYSDIKGRLLEVKATPEEIPHEFISNARLRGVPEGRKDDLQTIGYLAIYLLEGKLPWTMSNIMQVRAKSTLQGLFGRHGRLLEFMAAVYQLSTDEQPNYDNLMNLIVL